MAKSEQTADDSSTEPEIIRSIMTTVEISQFGDGSWIASQPDLEVTGQAETASRAVEAFARSVAEKKERGEL